jgi:hypothetical protein
LEIKKANLVGILEIEVERAVFLSIFIADLGLFLEALQHLNGLGAFRRGLSSLI